MGITAEQFQEMTQRVAGRRKPGPVLEATAQVSLTSHRLILGIDPSLRGTGYGLIRLAKPHPVAVVYGTVHCPPGWPRSRCLLHIATCLRDLLKQHHPDVCVIEGLFYAQNLQTALIMGEARGAALVAVAEAGVDVFEIAPRKVKQAIVGYGAAQKLAVAKMVQRMLRLGEAPEPDAADALALALAQGQEQGRYVLTRQKKV